MSSNSNNGSAQEVRELDDKQGGKGNKKGKHSVDMTEGPFLKKMIFFAIPIILSGLLQSLYNAADLIVVNFFTEGDTAVGAIGCTSAITNLVLALVMGLSVGAGVLVAHYVGAKQYDDVKSVVNTSVVLSLVFGVAIAIVGFFISKPLLVLMDTSPAVLPYATLYMKIIFLGAPASLLYNYIASMLRSAGDSKRPLIFLALSGLLNVLLNVFLVTVFNMDVAGVAIATIASQYASAIMAVGYLMRTDGEMKIVLKDLKVDFKKFKKMLYIGIPSGIQGSLFSLSNTLIQAAMNSIDQNFDAGNGNIVAGFASAANLEGFLYIALHSIYSVSLTFVGQSVGAKKYENVKKLTGYAVLIVIALGFVMGGGMMIFREPLLRLYVRGDVAMSAAMTRFCIIIPTYFLCGIMDTLCGTLRALNKSLTSMVISLISTCGVRILWIHTVFAYFGTGEILFLSYPVTWILSLSVHLIFIIITTNKMIKRQRSEPLLASEDI